MTTITISTEQTTIANAYAAIQEAIGSGHPRWIAVTDDYSYISGANNRVVGAVGAPDSGSRLVYRSDSSYNRMRKFAGTSTAGCSLPAGTVFKVFVFPES